MSLWTCIKCGARAIAHDLGFCPQCGRERSAMPRTTVGGGGTNAREPNDPVEVSADTPEVPEASEAVSGPSEPEVVAAAVPPPPPPPVTPPQPPRPPAVNPGKDDED